MATIFVVDDEIEIAKLLTDSFEETGYDVCFYTNPIDALQAFNVLKCDLVISDIKMPNLTGFELLAKAKDKLGGKCPPFVFCTAFHNQFDREIVDCGVQDVIDKPVDFNRLSTVAHQLIAKKSAMKSSV